MQSIFRTILPFLAFIALVSCSQSESAQQPASKAIPIKTGEVRRVQQRQFVSVSGTVASPDAAVPVSFLVSGKVIQVAFREGDYIKQGQLLAAIDPTDYRLSLQIETAHAEEAKITLDRCKDEYARMKSLYASKVLPENNFKKFKTAWLRAEQQVNLTTANQQLAQKHLSDASLHAPAEGFISKRSIEPGQTASPGSPVFEIVKLDPVEINVGVPETDIHLVRIGQKAAVTIPALPSESFEGKVRVINVSADPNTRTYMTRIVVPNAAHTLRIGMVAEARIEGGKIVGLMTLPAETILRDPQGATIVFVYYPEQQRVYSKRIETGAVYGREIEIRSGLSGNEAIVIAGQEKLRDGAFVSLVKDTASGGIQALPGKKEVRQ